MARPERRERRQPKAPADIVETSIASGFIALLAVAPLWYGSVFEWSWALNAVWAAILAIGVHVHQRNRPETVAAQPGLPAVPVAMFLVTAVWIAVQAGPWTPVFLHHPLWEMAARTLDAPLSGSLSLAPEQTWFGLLRFLTIGLVLWTAFTLAADPAVAEKLITAAAAIACAYSCYGLAEYAFGPGRVIFAPKNPFTLANYGNTVSATFVNANHYAAFAGMGVIASAALLFDTLDQSDKSRSRSTRKRVAALAARAVTHGGPVAALGLPSLLGIILSGSRAGIGCVVAGVAIVAALAARRASRSADRERSIGARYGMGLALAALCLVAMIGLIDQFGTTLTKRADTLDAAIGDRLAMARLNLVGSLQNPVLGYGYGAFEKVFPLYRDMTVGYAGVWNAAHNTYLETLLGLGLPIGFGIIAALAWLVVLCARGALIRRRRTLAPTVATAVAAQAGMHSLVEFPLQTESIALLFAALLGAGLAQSRPTRRDPAPTTSSRHR